jgi:hypothetical protein
MVLIPVAGSVLVPAADTVAGSVVGIVLGIELGGLSMTLVIVLSIQAPPSSPRTVAIIEAARGVSSSIYCSFASYSQAILWRFEPDTEGIAPHTGENFLAIIVSILTYSLSVIQP